MTFGVAHSLQELLLRLLSMNEGKSGTSGRNITEVPDRSPS